MGSPEEVCLDVEPRVTLPDLGRLPGVVQVEGAVPAELEATYLDTRDRALQRAGVTLCRCTGGADDGWHLVLPAGKERDRSLLPLSRSTVPPKRLREAVRGWTRDADLEPVARLSVVRSTWVLVGDDGAVAARLTDDRVAGRALLLPESRAVEWRTWRVDEAADRSLVAAVVDVLVDAGAVPDTTTELARVLGAAVPSAPPLPRPTKRRPASLVLHARLAEQVAEVGRRDSEVRRGGPEGVHKLRVACRRLRGALATFRPLVDRQVTDPIRDELRWLAHALGEARDLEVAHARLRGLVDEQPGSLVVGPVRRRLDRTYRPLRKQAVASAHEALDSDRYFALRAQLDQLAAAPPFTVRAEAEARDVLPRRLRKELRRVATRAARARGDLEPDERDETTHDVRRAVKRLRYAAEAVRPVWPDDAAAVAKEAKRVASSLGVRQDAVVARPQLVELAREATAAGESAFTYGLLHAEERRRTEVVDERLDAMLDRLGRCFQQARW